MPRERRRDGDHRTRGGRVGLRQLILEQGLQTSQLPGRELRPTPAKACRRSSRTRRSSPGRRAAGPALRPRSARELADDGFVQPALIRPTSGAAFVIKALFTTRARICRVRGGRRHLRLAVVWSDRAAPSGRGSVLVRRRAIGETRSPAGRRIVSTGGRAAAGECGRQCRAPAARRRRSQRAKRFIVVDSGTRRDRSAASNT